MFEFFGRIMWIIFVWMLYSFSYEGVELRSIHYNTPKININLDGDPALVFGVLAFIAATYYFYLFFASIGSNVFSTSTDKKDDSENKDK